MTDLITKWRAKAAEADALIAKFEAKGDSAGNAYAFLKERRIWTTCADELAAERAAAVSPAPLEHLLQRMRAEAQERQGQAEVHRTMREWSHEEASEAEARAIAKWANQLESALARLRGGPPQ